MLDITGADLVEVLIRGDNKVVWVNVNGECVFRVCQIKELNLEHMGKNETSQTGFKSPD